MILTSPAFEDGGIIPKKFSCDGENVSPELSIVVPPENAKSLVLIMEDLDSPSGTWNHWLVWNIEPGIETILENSFPMGAKVGVNDFGGAGYGGPCPQSGEHRYYFRLYALGEKLKLMSGANRVDLTLAMRGKVLMKAELMGRYGR